MEMVMVGAFQHEMRSAMTNFCGAGRATASIWGGAKSQKGSNQESGSGLPSERYSLAIKLEKEADIQDNLLIRGTASLVFVTVHVSKNLSLLSLVSDLVYSLT